MIREFVNMLVSKTLRMRTENAEKALKDQKHRLDCSLDKLLSQLITFKHPRPTDRGKDPNRLPRRKR